MYITQEVLNRIERKYGVPKILRTHHTMNRTEFDLLKWSMRNGRRHDVTLFISNEGKDKIAVIRSRAILRVSTVPLAVEWNPERILKLEHGEKPMKKQA